MDSPVWSELQITPTNDVRAIRRAYTQRLNQVHPEDDAEGFKRLRTAYESAIFWASLPEVFALKDDGAVQQSEAQSSTLSSDVLPDRPPLRERASNLVEGILDLSENTGEHAATESLVQLLRSEELQNIELKDFFDEALVDRLMDRKNPPFVLLDKIALELKWDRNQFFVNDLSNKRHLLDRLEGWREYRKLLNARSSPRPEFVTPFQSRVAAMLTSPYDPWRFYMNRILRIGLAEAVQNRIELLRTYAPAFEEHLDSKTMEWWTKRKITGGSLVALIVMTVVTVTFVVNNFTELPSVFIAPLGAAALLFAYAIWKKWPTMQVLSNPQKVQSFAKPFLQFLTIPVAAVMITIFRALPSRISLPLVALVVLACLLRYWKFR